MSLTVTDWHDRFVQQARWTQDLRAYLYAKIGLDDGNRILDLGCGTGALIGETISRSKAWIHGLDRSRTHLKLISPEARLCLSQGDAHQTPYADKCFDVTLCHFTLLWVVNPTQVVREMARITRPGGTVLALAEPDYGGRIDYPSELALMGKWQIESLQAQGADPMMGRKLATIFNDAGFDSVETGVLGGQWPGKAGLESWHAEWEILAFDSNQMSKLNHKSEIEFEEMKKRDKNAWETGRRVLFVPTFYALGKMPEP
ncbi:MAG: methyltransferase domain-containing protein [Chloroflexi bacterium]|nr:methyltransferase domain-containing protein [Chloroflexota bacterium]